MTTVPIANPIPERIPKGELAVELQTVADNLISPLGIAVPDDRSGRMFIYDQSGLVHVLNTGGLLPTPLLDARSRLVVLGNYDERGLLGLATHPDFLLNPLIYTYTSEPATGTADFTAGATNHNHQSVIAEWRMDAVNPNQVDPSSRRELLRIDQPQGNHNGGTLRFGPDGFLYISLGDGGRADDEGDGHSPGGNAQNTSVVYGKLLRIDVDATDSTNAQYGIPNDNPYLGLDEIFAYGLRNPFSFSFDRANGNLYLADVGQNKMEEVNLIVNGGNYGWRVKEGTFYFDPNGAAAGYVTDTPVAPAPFDLIDPIAEYDHDDGTAVVGGYVYRGSQVTGLGGRYLFGDWGTFGAPSGRLFYLDAGNTIRELRIGANDRALGYWIKGFGEDAAGELYVMVSRTLGPIGNTGRVLKIVEASNIGHVMGRWLFYNGSAWDGNNAADNASDDGAVAADKAALLSGGAATFANYTSYSKGINGIMVDIAGLAGTPSASDFSFKIGNDNTPATWATAPPLASISVRNAAGQTGSDRVTIIWPDNAIQKQWLQVTVKATANTGLGADDVFYFGNAIGETGNSTGDAQANSTDVNGARMNPRFSINPAGIGDVYDFNRDKLVNSTDVNLARIHTTFSINALRLILP